MARDFLFLVNRLRERLNEVTLTSITWSQAVGYDALTKTAINLAYFDIINEDTEWPFLHQEDDFLIDPGQQFYTLNLAIPPGFSEDGGYKGIDWEGFWIDTNESIELSIENHVVPSSSPWAVDVAFKNTFYTNGGVLFPSFIPPTLYTAGDPEAVGEYHISNGTYYFNSTEAGMTATISYQHRVQPVVGPVSRKYLSLIDADFWRQNLLNRDQGFVGTPDHIFKTQKMNQVGISPTPDRIYKVHVEYWLDPLALVEMTDTIVLPDRYAQIILDGALKYCHEFKEDAILGSVAEKKFDKGLARMRTELINRNQHMRSGFIWPHRALGNF